MSFANGKNVKPTWHKGPPPHIGWWVATARRNQGTWRWWDGVQWSRAVTAGAPPLAAAKAASVPMAFWAPARIEWTDEWPHNARCPRIDPNPQDTKRVGRQLLAIFNDAAIMGDQIVSRRETSDILAGLEK